MRVCVHQQPRACLSSLARWQVVHGCVSPWTVRVRDHARAVLCDAALAPLVRYLPAATEAAVAATEAAIAAAAMAVAGLQRYWAPEVLHNDAASSAPAVDVYGVCVRVCGGGGGGRRRPV